VIPSTTSIFLSQRKYITDLLNKSGMVDTKPSSTPLSAIDKLLKDSGDLLPSPIEYRALGGSLQYLSLTHPDIAFITNKLTQFMQNPNTTHWTALKRMLRYLAGSCDKGVFISLTTPLISTPTRMRTRKATRMIISPPLVIGYILEAHPSLGALENNVLLLDLPQKQNIKPWLTRQVSYYGSFPYSPNLATLQ